MTRDLFRIVCLLIAACVGAVALVGCSSGSAQDTPTTGQNQQDAVFAQQLNELSEQLVQITDVLIGRSESPATQAQLEELARVGNERSALARAWLARNGRTNSEAPPAPGLLTDAQFNALIESTGTDLLKAIGVAAAKQKSGMRQICEQEIASGQNSELKTVAEELLTKSSTELQSFATNFQ